MENHRFRENVSDKSLREFFNTKNNTPNKRYKPEDYNRLRREYNVLLDANRNGQRVKKNNDNKIKRQTMRHQNETMRNQIVKIEKPDFSKLRQELKPFIGKSIVVEYLVKVDGGGIYN